MNPLTGATNGQREQNTYLVELELRTDWLVDTMTSSATESTIGEKRWVLSYEFLVELTPST